MKRTATALLLTGGQSTRMGRDKALLPWQGKTLIEHVHAQLLEHFVEVLVASGTPERYAALGIEGIADAPGVEGPMAGLLAGLEHASCADVYIHPVDNPDVDEELLRSLFCALEVGVHATVLESPSGLEPLIAIYHRSSVLAFREAAAARRFGVQAVLARLKVARVKREHAVRNLNEPGDLDGA